MGLDLGLEQIWAMFRLDLDYTFYVFGRAEILFEFEVDYIQGFLVFGLILSVV